jgi:hypothetical protein
VEIEPATGFLAVDDAGLRSIETGTNGYGLTLEIEVLVAVSPVGPLLHDDDITVFGGVNPRLDRRHGLIGANADLRCKDPGAAKN